VIYETVTVERRDSVVLVSLNRPEALNSFNATQRAELLAAVREVNEDESVRVAVLTGSGRAFSAGADLQETPENGEAVETQLNEEYKPILMAISEAPKPWISAVNGACAGVGSSFAMACDLTVMADNAYMYQAFTAISLVPDGGATWHLVRTLGRKRAYEVIATGEKVRAQK
jgi:2-(1,2-epoxy-1,2-dihydrophenyl)acetyl-CoA isomerase